MTPDYCCNLCLIRLISSVGNSVDACLKILLMCRHLSERKVNISNLIKLSCCHYSSETQS